MKFTESELESAAMELFVELGYEVTAGADIHRNVRDVLIRQDLDSYLLRRYFDLDLSESELESIFRQIEVVGSGGLYSSNRQLNTLIADGLILERDDTAQARVHIRFVDHQNSEINTFRVVTQLEVRGQSTRIPDAVVFVNGIPVVVFEFKSAISESATLADAHRQVTIRYKRDIPQLLTYNSFVVLSDGANTKMGSLFAGYEYFYSWRKVSADEAPSDGVGTLVTMMRGLFAKDRLVDVICNFVMFPDASSRDEKFVCRYPQYFAARKLFESIKSNMRPSGDGRGGTYFGATGSGKSLTMVFLARLLMRSREMENPTILLITDRNDLDHQLSQLFVKAKGFIGEETVTSVESREGLRQKLRNVMSGGIYLTTVQKFAEDTELLSKRTNIVCISDEAHRSQINLEQKIRVSPDGVTRSFGFAKYLHDSLPNATYVGVTGTPIDGTFDVFGPTADSYTLRDSVIDEITVPISYEGRAAKVLLDDAKLEEIEKFYSQSAIEGTSTEQIEQSKRAVAKLEIVLGDDTRLAKVAEDFVQHYERRSLEGISPVGKAIFVCANRNIAWKFYKAVLRVRPNWGSPPVLTSAPEFDSNIQGGKIRPIMTRNKDDEEELYNLLGSSEHRQKMDHEFKDASSEFSIAIVVDMWLTGFDVPSLDVIYIDKPIQKHSLIQTISRVNRIFPGKDAGLVVDYIGLRKSLDEALSMYGSDSTKTFIDVEKSVGIFRDHLELLGALFSAFNSEEYFSGTPLRRLICLNAAVEYCQIEMEVEDRFRALMSKLSLAYGLCSTSSSLTEQERDRYHFYFAIRSILSKISTGDSLDVSRMNSKVSEMISNALLSDGIDAVVDLDAAESKKVLNLFDESVLNSILLIDRPNTKIKLLERLLRASLAEFRKTNLAKAVDFSKRLKGVVDAYNDRSESAVMKSHVLDDLAERLAALFRELSAENGISMTLGVTYEERAFFDILKSISEKYDFAYPEESLTSLARAIKTIVDEKSSFTDWANRSDIRAELRVDLILLLDEHGFPPVPKDEIFAEIFEQAENFKLHADRLL